jgi:hypothetical protein
MATADCMRVKEVWEVALSYNVTTDRAIEALGTAFLGSILFYHTSAPVAGNVVVVCSPMCLLHLCQVLHPSPPIRVRLLE